MICAALSQFITEIEQESNQGILLYLWRKHALRVWGLDIAAERCGDVDVLVAARDWWWIWRPRLLWIQKKSESRRLEGTRNQMPSVQLKSLTLMKRQAVVQLELVG
jgi:hypothetical protein